MHDLARTYGKTLLILVIVSAIWSLLFGSGGLDLFGKLADHLTVTEKIVQEKGAKISKQLFLEPTAKVCPKKGLEVNIAYKIRELVQPVDGESALIEGGKVIKVMRLYDGPSGEQELSDVSEECVRSLGAKVLFPSRGLYLLMVSLRDDKKRNALQYLYISIEGELNP